LKIPSKEDIQDILKVCEPIETALVLAGVSSGLSAIELCNLKVADFKNGYDPDTGITTLHIRRVKTRVDFITFFTPEASKAIIEYLEYRNRTPKTRKKEKNDCSQKTEGNSAQLPVY
jgi:integrase